ncbi:TIGR02530 family flagellar biosynthesis protein [Oceanobacillus sp. Castelsardo]|uniref:TIGR02530 family flagellar biosynthesis protein n=1 Tax=Oceanobacillus sp. Castelsardo TaxID=1851204 RepID=UPI000838C0E5|nr:TIGR02530 family flagellar biosynthesis protein [Oceanobacillus sp. Castelsardo]
MDHRVHQVPPQYALHFPTGEKKVLENTNHTFKEILANQQKLKISKHASQRLTERNIDIDDKEWQLIETKMAEARKKGITDSLVVTNHAALLVSTKNNTVVTAMNKEEANHKIFTNINGTILIND